MARWAAGHVYMTHRDACHSTCSRQTLLLWQAASQRTAGGRCSGRRPVRRSELLVTASVTCASTRLHTGHSGGAGVPDGHLDQQLAGEALPPQAPAHHAE